MKNAISIHRFGRLFGLGLALGLALPVAAITTNISTVGFSFSPANVTIKTNDTVHWINNGAFHTVNSANVPVAFPGAASGFQTYDFTFTTPGIFNYYCANHGFPNGGMNGNVTVTAPPSVTVTTPDNTTVFADPASFSVGSDAGAPVFVVTKVQLYTGASPVG